MSYNKWLLLFVLQLYFSVTLLFLPSKYEYVEVLFQDQYQQHMQKRMKAFADILHSSHLNVLSRYVQWTCNAKHTSYVGKVTEDFPDVEKDESDAVKQANMHLAD